jgi:hypothetical protein
MLRAYATVGNVSQSITIQLQTAPRRRTPKRKAAPKKKGCDIVPFTGRGYVLGRRPGSVRRSERITRPTAKAAESAEARNARIAELAIVRKAKIARNIRVEANKKVKKVMKPLKLTPKDRNPSGGGEGGMEIEPGDPIEVQVNGMVIGGGTTAYILADLGNTPLNGGRALSLEEIGFVANYREAVREYNADKIKFTPEVYRAHPWLL